MANGRTIKAQALRGLFDPSRQPEAATGQPLELTFFAGKVRLGLSVTKAVLADEDRYGRWPIASRLLSRADRIGFDHRESTGPSADP